MLVPPRLSGSLTFSTSFWAGASGESLVVTSALKSMGWPSLPWDSRSNVIWNLSSWTEYGCSWLLWKLVPGVNWS